MSRLTSLSPAALKAMFSPDADDTLMSLLTLTGSGIVQPVRLVDNYTHRFEYLNGTQMTVTVIATNVSSTFTYASTDAIIKDAINSDIDNPIYGTISNSRPFIFLPYNLTLPTEEQAAAPRCSITINDVSRLMIPILRPLQAPPLVSISLVLSNTPDAVEVNFPDFLMGGISYNASSITAELTVESLATEPFPSGTFTQSNFQGLF